MQSMGLTASIPYRGDIEGLRGVAVALVVAFHLDLFVPGGFIGVDVFYVISGFLIASLIERGVTLRPASLADFYSRRLKRLLPAFLVMLAVTTAACLLLMLPEDLIGYWKSVRESLLFRSNRFFAREIASYFAPDASTLPLLHTWSLSIEWQYYLLFPAGFLLLKRFVPRRMIFGSMLALTAMLVAVSVLEAGQPGGAYFSATARAFEFMLGASIALAPTASLARKRANVVVAAALAGLAYLAFAFSPRVTFPGLNALLVCLLAGLVIRYGAASTLLAGRGTVYLGQRSYSIYLWHWPIVALAGYLDLRSATSLPVNLALLIPILLISELSYSFVERPGLRARMGFAGSSLLLYAAPLLVAVALMPVLRHYDGFPGRLGPEAARIFGTLKAAARDRERCNDLDPGADIEQCAFGDLGASDRALLLGDSHAQHYWAFVDVLAKQARVKVYGLTNGECLALEGVHLIRNGRPYAGCTEATRAHYEMIAGRGFRFVILAQRWIGYPESELALLDGSIEAIVRSGATPVVLKQVAEDGRNPSKCFFRHIKLRQRYQEDCDIAADNPFAREKKRYVDGLIARAGRRFPSLVVIDVQRVQCGIGPCATVIEGAPIYSDLHHLSDYGSETLARRLVSLTGNPLLAADRASRQRE